MLWRSSPDGINFTTRHRFEQNGDVIIGSENPATARLEVKGIGTGSGSTAFKIRDGNDGELMRFQADGKMSIGHTGSLGRQLNINGGINLYKDEANFAGAIAPAATDHLAIFTNYINTSVLELQPAFGVVTIGTTTPATGYILSVDGKAIAEEVKVQISGSWPDYVFKDDYKLMSLSSLRASLKKNGHLPNMPSAQKVNSDNGIELGEMNKKLLEKVEELTLYILGLDARIKAMEEKYEQKK